MIKTFTLLFLMLGTILEKNIMAEKQKSGTYDAIFNASSEKFIPVKHAEKIQQPDHIVSGATMEKAYLMNKIEEKVVERELDTAQNNIYWKYLVGKITSLVKLPDYLRQRSQEL